MPRSGAGAWARRQGGATEAVQAQRSTSRNPAAAGGWILRESLEAGSTVLTDPATAKAAEGGRGSGMGAMWVTRGCDAFLSEQS